MWSLVPINKAYLIEGPQRCGLAGVSAHAHGTMGLPAFFLPGSQLLLPRCDPDTDLGTMDLVLALLCSGTKAATIPTPEAPECSCAVPDLGCGMVLLRVSCADKLLRDLIQLQDHVQWVWWGPKILHF